MIATVSADGGFPLGSKWAMSCAMLAEVYTAMPAANSAPVTNLLMSSFLLKSYHLDFYDLARI